MLLPGAVWRREGCVASRQRVPSFQFPGNDSRGDWPLQQGGYAAKDMTR